MNTFAERLTFARKLRGLSKKDLAVITDLTPRSISALEAGDHPPLKNTLETIATKLDLPVEFFIREEDIFIVQPEFVSFRKASKVTARVRDIATQNGSLGNLMAVWLDHNFHLPEPEMPSLADSSPQLAAEQLRVLWQIGSNAPIEQLLDLLEACGVLVLALPEMIGKKVDAFCFGGTTRPIVMLNTFKSAERLRFDLAHELGHLLMHQDLDKSPSQEKEADLFASSFLMPASGVKERFGFADSLESLLREKSYWRVSAFAYVRRLHDLDIVNDWSYEKICIELSRMGYRTSERDGIEYENSQLLEKVLKILRSEGKSLTLLADALSVSLNDIKSLFYRLTMIPV